MPLDRHKHLIGKYFIDRGIPGVTVHQVVAVEYHQVEIVIIASATPYFDVGKHTWIGVQNLGEEVPEDALPLAILEVTPL